MAIPAQIDLEKVLVGAPALDNRIDQLGESIQGFVRDLFARRGASGRQLRNVLNGVWLGHPLHAAITDLPVGAWTSAMILDYLGALTRDRYLRSAGDATSAIAVVGGIGAAIAGLADYSEIESEQRRFGTVHGIFNALGLGFLTYSMIRRLTGNRSGALMYTTVGYILTFIGADLGGTMVYRYGTAVNRSAWAEGPQQFTAVLPSNELRNGQKRVVESNGMKILLARIGGELYAINNTCTHWGCSLDQGELTERSVICHCHGSQFSLVDGAVLSGPANSPEQSFDVREFNGQIEIKQRPY